MVKRKKRATRAKPEEVKAGATGKVGFLVGDLEVAYAIRTNKRDGNLFHLLKLEIQDDRVVRVDVGIENLRAVLLAEIEDHILRNV